MQLLDLFKLYYYFVLIHYNLISFKLLNFVQSIKKSLHQVQMIQKLTVQKFNAIKTQKCTNQQCPVYKLFSNEVRARYYQLVFSIDKCCFNCFAYHTEADKRRKTFSQSNESVELAYQSKYMVDFSVFNKKKSASSESYLTVQSQYQNSKDPLNNTCHNLVEHLYHPEIYKTISCPLGESKEKANSKKTPCNYIYCPFIHTDQKLEPELQNKLISYRKNANISKIDESSAGVSNDKKRFEQKLLNIMLLRSCKSIQDLYKREVNLLKKMQNNQYSVIQEENNEDCQQNSIDLAAQDKSQIQRIKERLKSKAEYCLRIDREKQNEQQSRKIVDKPSMNNEKQNNITLNKKKDVQQIEQDSLGISYNYFKYGEKLSLIEGRTVEFKHFKDISDPNHIPLIMRYITAFLNSEGGKLYIGVDDNSYVYGAKFKQYEYDKLLLNIDREGRFCMSPPLMPQKYSIKLIPVNQDKKEQERQRQRWVIEVTVFTPKEQTKRLYLYNKECYMRMNASTHKLNASDIIEYISLNSSGQPNDLSAKQDEAKILKDQVANKNAPVPREQVTFAPRQNQLMSHDTSIPSVPSSSRPKFQTEESKIKQFQQKLNKKSIEDLCILKKDYEQKLIIILETYKKKQRETR